MNFSVTWFLLLSVVSAIIHGKGPSAADRTSIYAQGSPKFSPFNSPDFCSQIITPTCNTTFSYIDDTNAQIRDSLSQLVKTPYFRYFKLNFEKQCKFWNEQHFCATENCAVEILPASQYNWSDATNENLKPVKLGKINLHNQNSEDSESDAEPVQVCEDLDYSHIDDDHQCVYVNLLNNPERFTGYGGTQSFNVWKAIYSENCFPDSENVTADEDDHCVEKNLFYRVVSGLHASIAVHLSNEYVDLDSGEFYPNLKLFMERVGLFNDRLSNIYFNYALVSQALVKLGEILPLKDIVTYDDNANSSPQHRLIQNDPEVQYDQLLDGIIPVLSANTLFNTSNLFNPELVAPGLKEEFRARFKNISAIMDCVGCDRCRMWGKLQTIGYGTALKILFEGETPETLEQLSFRRIELVALVNTFDRLSKSIEAINGFKQQYLEHLEDVKNGIVKPGEYDKKNDSNKGLTFPFFKVPDSAPLKEPMSSLKEPVSQNSEPTEGDSIRKTKKPGKKILSPAALKKKINADPSVRKQPRTFKEDFKIAFNDVYQATLFVLRSYRDLPVNLWKIAVVNLNEAWEILIGKPKKYEYHSELSLDNDQEDYDHLFQ